MKFITLVFVFLFTYSCAHKNASSEYELKIRQHRDAQNDFMKNSPDSPFNAKTKVDFHPLKFYDPDTNFIFRSRLFLYDEADSLLIYGTKGEPRKTWRIGFFTLNYNSVIHRLNLYKSISRSGKEYHGIWFTDETTGDETYGVGRYLDFEMSEDVNNLYTIDFNYAYNPYCSYSSEYSCAIPTKEDHLRFEVKAGEKIFHD
ncbi:MAG: DUF1684 domain-containing protein [Ignavibacteriales bacterium]|nr:DUF1684 domain-containing protein [Ignavibacteriales bacterium]MCF8438162.1 DUF1684 domain-containing protein [Ignavibacteriales bacterium]